MPPMRSKTRFVLVLTFFGIIYPLANVHLLAQQKAADNSRQLVTADLNGTWKIESIKDFSDGKASKYRSDQTYKSDARRISTVVDFERLSLWVVFDEGEVLHPLEFVLTDVDVDHVVFERNASRENTAVFGTPTHASLKFNLKTRVYSLDARFNRWSTQLQFKKFINSVPVQSISAAAQKRREKMKGLSTSSLASGEAVESNEWVYEFLAVLEPLADGVLEEYGRQLATGQEPRIRQSGMAAASALLKLTVQGK